MALGGGRRHPLQGGGVGLDADGRAAAAGGPIRRRAGQGNAKPRAARPDPLLLERVPTVCLFVRADNAAAIGLYDSVGMTHVLDYRSVLL